MPRVPALASSFLCLALAAACASSRAGGLPPGDGGPADAAPIDAARPVDAGHLPGAVCAEAAAAAAAGVLGHRFERNALLAIGAGGREAVRATFFEGAPAPPEPVFRQAAFRGARWAAVALRETSCSGSLCSYAAEVAVGDADGGRHFDLGTFSSGHPTLLGLTEDGVALLLVPEGRGLPYVARVVDPTRGLRPALPAGVLPVIAASADAAGWRPASLDPETAPFEPVAAFVRLEDGAVRRLDGDPRRATAWGSRWVFLEGASEGAPRLVIAGADERTEVALPSALADAHRAQVDEGVAILWGAGPRVAGVVELARRRVSVVPRDAWPGEGFRFVRTIVAAGWFVAATDGAPVVRVSLDDGAVHVGDLLLPPDAEALAADYCTEPPWPLADGRLALGLRRRGAPSGVHLVGAGGEAGRVGAPLHGVLTAAVRRTGETWMIRGVSGVDTFCPPLEPWEEPPAEGALVGDSLQLVRDDGARYTLPARASVPWLDPTGTCAVYAEELGEPGLVMLDLTTGEAVTLSGSDWLAPP